MSVKIISRAITIKDSHVLLVKNANKGYWSLPGGHWEPERETLQECAQRGLLEETGYHAKIHELLLVQEFESNGKKIIEFIWRASLTDGQSFESLDQHKDTDIDSEIDEMQWISSVAIDEVSVRPLAVKEYVLKGAIPVIFQQS